MQRKIKKHFEIQIADLMFASKGKECPHKGIRAFYLGNKWVPEISFLCRCLRTTWSYVSGKFSDCFFEKIRPFVESGTGPSSVSNHPPPHRIEVQTTSLSSLAFTPRNCPDREQCIKVSLDSEMRDELALHFFKIPQPHTWIRISWFLAAFLPFSIIKANSA